MALKPYGRHSGHIRCGKTPLQRQISFPPPRPGNAAPPLSDKCCKNANFKSKLQHNVFKQEKQTNFLCLPIPVRAFPVSGGQKFVFSGGNIYSFKQGIAENVGGKCKAKRLGKPGLLKFLNQKRNTAMKKSLIALTLAALPVAATADVTLYGAIKAGVQTYRSVGHREGKVVGVETGSEISDFGSKIGFKGQEDLGNGLKAVWQLEQGASVAGTNTGWGNKQSFIGLKGGFGTIRVGSLNSPLKNTGANVNAWESGKYTGEFLEISKMAGREHRYLSARYDSPEFAGFSGSVQYAPKDNSGSNGESYHVGLNYRNGGFFAQYAGLFQRYGEGTRYAYYNIPSLFVEKLQVHRLVGGYDNNALYASVAAQQQDAKLYGTWRANSHNSQTEVAATAAYRFGNLTPRVSYAHGFKGSVHSADYDNTYDQVVVGAEYDFSKRTSALVSAGWLQEGKGADKVVSTASAVVLRHKF